LIKTHFVEGCEEKEFKLATVIDEDFGDVPSVDVDDNEHGVYVGNEASFMSYPILQEKPCTHRMCAQDHLFHTHGHKVFTDSQIS
jgi:hypothetical protein